jgi:RNA polymerase sigma factor (sigma-70 family)
MNGRFAASLLLIGSLIKGVMEKEALQRSGVFEPSATAAFERYARALNRYLMHRVRRPEDAADLTQDIFERFVRRKDRTKVVHDPLAYLFRIAFHVVGEALADEDRNPVRFDSKLVAEDLRTIEAVSSNDAAEELAVEEDVRAALASLPAGHLTALLLVEGHGMSYREAALASGFTPSTIATYVMNGRAALKLALDDSWSERDSRK